MFPLARRIGFLFSLRPFPSRLQRQAAATTPGNLESFQTHRLTLRGPEGQRQTKRRRVAKRADCSCRDLSLSSRFLEVGPDRQFIDEVKRTLQERVAQGDRSLEPRTRPPCDARAAVESSYGVDWENHEFVLEHTARLSPNLPFLVISASKDIVPNHGGIFNERFLEFLRRFYFRHLALDLPFPAECNHTQGSPRGDGIKRFSSVAMEP